MSVHKFAVGIISLLVAKGMADQDLCQSAMVQLLDVVRTKEAVQVSVEILKDSYCVKSGFIEDSMTQVCQASIQDHWHDMTLVVFTVPQEAIIGEVCNQTTEARPWSCWTCRLRMESTFDLIFVQNWNKLYHTLKGPEFCESLDLYPAGFQECQSYLADIWGLAMENLFFPARQDLAAFLCLSAFGQFGGELSCIQVYDQIQRHLGQPEMVERSAEILKGQVCPQWPFAEEADCLEAVERYWPSVVFRAGNSTWTSDFACNVLGHLVPETENLTQWDGEQCSARVEQIQPFLRTLELPLAINLVNQLMDLDSPCDSRPTEEEISRCNIEIHTLIPMATRVLIDENGAIDPYWICYNVFAVCVMPPISKEDLNPSTSQSHTSTHFIVLVLFISQWPLYHILK